MNTKNQKLTEKLNQLLADYQIYYQNLRGLHWNVKGPQFFMLHGKYEELYNEAAEVIDEIAERILMVGGQPLHTFEDYLKTAQLKVVAGVSDGKQGVEVVLDNSRSLLERFNEILELADGDEGTSALVSDLIGAAEKRIWMLSAYLG
ncbi:Dps family protein [Mariniphaga sediminis]|uniref:Dps family protein n=1 Tax=Mariniphaga sediminis TaxID=1628158 RepID=UPI003561B584